MAKNRLRARASAGEPSFGGWCVSGSTFAAEVLGAEGFDYVCVDCQHGLVDFDGMWPMLQAMRWTSATPVVRVPFNHTPWPGRALDAGAEAVIVPMVNTREDAEMAAAACRYAPLGVRSFGPVRANLFLGQDPAEVNAEILCLVMIETVRAVENVDAICSTPGVDGVYIGPADLSLTMGLTPATMHKSTEHADAVTEILGACQRQGIIAGIHTAGGEQARRYAEAGFTMCTLPNDAVLLRTMVRQQLAAARGGEVRPTQSPYG